MFNWLQHLFTVRAISRENACLRAEVSQLEAKVNNLESEIDEYKQIINVKDEEIRSLNNRLDSIKQNRPLL